MGTGGWVVVLEVETVHADGAIERWRLGRLLEQLPGGEPIGLHSTDRVALQLSIAAPDAGAALSLALARVRTALPKVGLRDLQLLRAEVLTRHEFDRECALAAGDGPEEGYQTGLRMVEDSGNFPWAG